MRLVVRCDDARAARAAQTLLAGAGCEALALPGPVRPAPHGEDIAIFPANARTITAAAERAEAALGLETPPLACVLALTEAAPPGLAKDLGPFLGAVALDAPAALLTRQMAALQRLAILEEERVRRTQTGAAFAVEAPASPADGALRALYIGAPSTAYLALDGALAEQGGVTTAAFSSFAGFDHLHDDHFDAVVLNAAQNPSTSIALCAALRRNASLYHMPTLVVIKADDEKTAAAVIARGATAIVKLNAPSAQPLGWLFEAVRRERTRRSSERVLRGLRDKMGDPRTGLMLRTPFEAHLARLAGDHHRSGRPLALAVLRALPAHGARMPEASIWRRGFNEIASLAARLQREADCAAALGDDLIAIALPCAQLRGAQRMAGRIAAVAECTAFASGEMGSGPLVFEQSAAELQPGESGGAMLARALRAIEDDSATA